jgi:hypothetical protein
MFHAWDRCDSHLGKGCCENKPRGRVCFCPPTIRGSGEGLTFALSKIRIRKHVLVFIVVLSQVQFRCLVMGLRYESNV